MEIDIKSYGFHYTVFCTAADGTVDTVDSRNARSGAIAFRSAVKHAQYVKVEFINTDTNDVHDTWTADK